MKRASLILPVAVALLQCMAGPANATPITYTESVTASGSIGAASFHDASVTFSLALDTTTAATVAGGIVNGLGTPTVTIAGIAGTATFTATNTFRIVLGNSSCVFCPLVGIWDPSAEVLGLVDGPPSLGTYDMQTGFGPVSGFATSALVDGIHSVTFGTTAGTLAFSDMGRTSTFSAQLTHGTVPEPASLSLLGLGLAAVGFIRRRRRA